MLSNASAGVATPKQSVRSARGASCAAVNRAASAMPGKRVNVMDAKATLAPSAPRYAQFRSHSSMAVRNTALNAVAVDPSQGPPQGLPVEEVKIDSVTSHSISDNVFLLRGNCSSRLKYEVEYSMKRGSTDNCYLMKVPGANVLIDVPYEAYAKPFCEALAALTPLNSLSHIIITNLDPKAIPCLKAVLQQAVVGRDGSKLVVVLSNPALRLLQSALGEKPEEAKLLSDIQLVVARSGTALSVGDTKLEAVLTPTPRWPDLMSIYYPDQKIMFTSKLFGAHVLPSLVYSETAKTEEGNVFDTGSWEAYGDDWRYYFECLLAPQARQMASALDKLDIAPVSGGTGGMPKNMKEVGDWLKTMLMGKRLVPFATASPLASLPTDIAPHTMDVSLICPMHGPLVKQSVAHLLREYREWTDEQIKVANSNSVAVLYASAYGNTATLAQALSRGVTKGGVAVEMINLETSTVEEVEEAIKNTQGFMIGSPTLGGHMPTQVQLALGSIIRQAAAKEMPCGVFGSFGWSGEAVDEMEQRLKDAGFRFAYQPIRVKFRPTAKDLQMCEESGRDLSVAIKRKLKAKDANAAAGDAKAVRLASGPQLAMGRVVGSLSVLTATDEDASSAMLASWISQASFNPPGITVSIKKDRAMEPLLSVGASFMVSMVAEGEEKVVMKKLARTFAPGEDRLAGLETFVPEGADTPVLKACSSYMVCKVESRMDAGDHLIVYASVTDGKVVAADALTAVHHRKVGSHY